jgi:hypothetical protein
MFPCLLALNVITCLLHLLEWNLMEPETVPHLETWRYCRVDDICNLETTLNLNQITKYPVFHGFPEPAQGMVK